MLPHVSALELPGVEVLFGALAQEPAKEHLALDEVAVADLPSRERHVHALRQAGAAPTGYATSDFRVPTGDGTKVKVEPVAGEFGVVGEKVKAIWDALSGSAKRAAQEKSRR